MIQRKGSIFLYMFLFFAGGFISQFINQATNIWLSKKYDIRLVQPFTSESSSSSSLTLSPENSVVNVKPDLSNVSPLQFSSVNEPMPKVYRYSEGSLKQVPNFCKWTPDYDCASMTTELGPMAVFIHPTSRTDVMSVSGALMNRGVWEPRIVKVLLKELKKHPEAGFVDIGCNVGPFSLLSAKLGHSVISVDAVVDNMLKVCRSVEKNNLFDKVLMVANPVFDEHKMVTLNIFPPRSYENTKILHDPVSKDHSVCGGSRSSPTVQLDDLLPLVTFKTAIMKIDVESFEFFVVNGGKKFFEQIDVQAIIMEWEHVKKTDKGKLLADILKNYNYTPYSVPENIDGTLLEYEKYTTWTHDVIFLKSN